MLKQEDVMDLDQESQDDRSTHSHSQPQSTELQKSHTMPPSRGDGASQRKRRTTEATTSRKSQRTTYSQNLHLSSKSNAKRLAAVDLVLDIGERNTVCGFRVYFDKAKVEKPTLQDLQLITWQNNQRAIWTQVAVAPTQGAPSTYGNLIWGVEVPRRLEDGSINYEDVHRNFKQALFRGEKFTVKKLHGLARYFLHEKNEAAPDAWILPGGQEEHATDESDSDDNEGPAGTHHKYTDEIPTGSKADALLLLSRYLYLTYNFAIDKIETIYDIKVDENTEIRVGLPLPIEVDYHYTSLVMAAAKCVGITNPIPMAEPAAALLFHILINPQEDVLGKTFIIVDSGACSVDVEAWTVVQVNPLRVAEASEAKTLWCGGNTVNDAAMKIIMDRIDDFDSILASMAEMGASMSRDEFEYKIREQLEVKKQEFDATRDAWLEIPLVPNIPQAKMTRGRGIKFEVADFEAAFQEPVKQIPSTINNIFQKLGKDATLVLSGGGNQSPYMQHRIKSYFQRDSASTKRHHLTITHPSEDNHGSWSVARGGLLLLAEQNLVTERKLRLAFSVAQYEERNLTRFPDKLWETGPDGRVRVQVTKRLFAAEKSHRIPAVAYVRGIRILTRENMDRSATSWKVTEKILLCPKGAQNDKAVKHPENKITALRQRLQFTIPMAMFTGVLPEQDEETGAEFWETEYEIEARLGQGNELEAKFVVPRSGKFSSKLKGQGWGDDYFFQEGKYDVTGVFTLMNSV